MHRSSRDGSRLPVVNVTVLHHACHSGDDYPADHRWNVGYFWWPMPVHGVQTAYDRNDVGAAYGHNDQQRSPMREPCSACRSN